MLDTEVHDLLSRNGLDDDIYRAMNCSDMSQVVNVTTDAVRRLRLLPTVIKRSKSETTSTCLRAEGNIYYNKRQYRKALRFYNEALKFAPKHSDAMVFAYSNRSAVLLAVKAFDACMKDIHTCLGMNCSKSITEKLKKRLSQCQEHVGQEILREAILSRDEFANYFFQFNVKRNPKIPCVSTDADVVFDESGATRVIAANDIRVGTVVALEEAFVGALFSENEGMSCSYCHKMGYNMTPCEGCCAALFCGATCQERCMREYHRIECQIVCHLGSVYSNPVHQLVTRAAIKISLKCKSWQEFVTASLNIGASRMRNSTINEIYDAHNNFSILCFDDNKEFIHGRMYKGSFVCAFVIDSLRSVPNYFPESSKERDAAQRALARVMMHLYVSFTNKIDISSFAYDHRGDTSLVQTNGGWFSFASKLKHSCEPNLLVMGLNKKVALVALQAIGRGEELSISYIPHWCDATILYNACINSGPKRPPRALWLFAATQLSCACRVCAGQCDVTTAKETHALTEKQKQYCQNAALGNCRGDSQMTFEAACRALHSLRGLENTEQYCAVYGAFIASLHYYQFITTNNVTASDDSRE